MYSPLHRTLSAPVARISRAELSAKIAETLQRHYAPFASAPKRIARDAGASPDAAENWLAGRNPPGPLQLLRLMAAVPPLAAEIRRLTAAEADGDPDFARDLAAVQRLAARLADGGER